ncbi:hypothetical protein B0H14DRAFT_3427067 [Mycena olivaceomarginata]|nr:hypothetical protein B0H14DRAFT_3427067 [Mycena olivaceomarginata]
MSTDRHASAPPEAHQPLAPTDFIACICLGRLALLPSLAALRLRTAPDWHRIVLALETQLPALRELDFGEGSVWWRYHDTWTKLGQDRFACTLPRPGRHLKSRKSPLDLGV